VSQNDNWSPDEPLDTETFEQGDEAIEDGTRLDPLLVEDIEQDPSLQPSLQVDERELAEAGAVLDDPEDLVTLDGGIDDPDGRDEPTGRSRRAGDGAGDDGWDLAAPLAADDDSDDELPD